MLEYVNNSCNNEEEEIKIIINSLLTDIIMKVLLMCQEHLAKLNRARVRRCRERKRQRHTNEYMRQVREQKRKNRRARRSNNGNHEDLL